MPLVTSPALVIAPSLDVPAHHPIVGYRNQVAFNNVVAESEDASYPATNLANPNTDLRWQSGGTAEQLITISDLSGECDYVGIARHNWGSTDVEVSIEAKTGEPLADWEEVLAGVFLSTDAPTIFRFAKGYYTDVRVRLIPDATAPRASVLYVGELLQLPQGLQPGFTPIHDGKDIEMLAGRSEKGEYLGAIITSQQLSSDAEFRAIRRADYDAYMRDFVDDANLGQPFFFAWEPSGHPDDVGFCWLRTTAQPVYATHNMLVAVTLPMDGLAL